MRRARRPERGAVLVEFALVSMLLITIVTGTIEIGRAWQDKLTVQTATQTGARVGSNLGPAATADYSLLSSVKSALQDIGLSNVNAVVVYKSTSATGDVPTACISPALTSVVGVCNAYTGAQLTALAANQFGCGAGKLDNAWCPTTRQNLLSVGPDYLGVYIKATTPHITKLFGDTQRISDRTVMRLEPLS